MEIKCPVCGSNIVVSQTNHYTDVVVLDKAGDISMKHTKSHSDDSETSFTCMNDTTHELGDELNAWLDEHQDEVI